MTRRLSRCTDRRGLVSVTMLIGLIILGLVAASLLKVAIARRGSVRSAEDQLQATLLLESGIDRALVRLDSNPKFTGDLWELTAQDLSGRGPAKVTTELKPATDPPGARRLIVTVDYLASTQHAVRLSRSIPLPLSSSAR